MYRKNSKLRKINLVSAIFFVFVAIFYMIYEKVSISKQVDSDRFAPVISVADGDTVTVILGSKEEKVRLIGIDAPELGQIPWGVESKKYLESLIKTSGSKARLEYDVDKRDKYGRILAYLWTKDGTLLNLSMVKNGQAVLYTFPPNVKYVNDLKAAQAEARNKRLGIWSEEGLKEMPRDYKKAHPRK
ncbi:MAG: thermonuclease family protein [Nitrospira sp.]|nr:thermonuclease family protein [Nitrospira sp.]